MTALERDLILGDKSTAERTLQALILLIESHCEAGKAAIGSFGQVHYDPAAVAEHTAYTKLTEYIRYLDETVYQGMNKQILKLLKSGRYQ